MAGLGGRYSGACARDAYLIQGLRARGHDVEAVALFSEPALDFPLERDPGIPIFLKGAHRWPTGKSGFGRRLARTVAGQWLVDRPGAYRSRLRGRAAAELAAGLDGPLAGEIRELADILGRRPPPDAVLLSHPYLAPLAALARERWRVPVVGMFAGEDTVVEDLPEPFRGRVRRDLRRHARHFDALFTVGRHASLRAVDFFALPGNRNRIVPIGIPAHAYARPDARPRDPFVIGYLSPVEPDKGLLILARAFGLLVRGKGRQASLRIAGEMRDPSYWRQVRNVFRNQELESRVTLYPPLSYGEKLTFFRELSVFSVPARTPEARGTAYLEAMAAGVPVAAPAIGAFPELLRRTGGGTLLPPDSPAMLAEAFALMMDDPATADSIGLRGQRAVRRSFSVEHAAAIAEHHLLDLIDGISPADRGDERGAVDDDEDSDEVPTDIFVNPDDY